MYTLYTILIVSHDNIIFDLCLLENKGMQGKIYIWVDRFVMILKVQQMPQVSMQNPIMTQQQANMVWYYVIK